MNDAVIPEIRLLLFSVLSGILCFFGYDLLLVLRAFLKRSVLLEKIEDILYWCAASIVVFSMIHRENQGVIRGYSVAGMLAGMILYRMVAKNRLVEGARRYAEKIGQWIKKKSEPLRKKKREWQCKREQVQKERKAKRQLEREAHKENRKEERAKKKHQEEKKHKKAEKKQGEKKPKKRGEKKSQAGKEEGQRLARKRKKEEKGNGAER